MFGFTVLLFILYFSLSRTRVIRNVDDDADQTADQAPSDNQHQATLVDRSKVTRTQFPSRPDYEVQWELVNNETIRVTFALFSSRETDDKSRHSTGSSSFRKFVSNPSSKSVDLIRVLHYSVFTIEQKETQMKTMLDMTPLHLTKHKTRNVDHLSESLTLERLSSKERYSICIYYYRRNETTRHPDLFICEDLINSNQIHAFHPRNPTYTLLVIVTQYSIIFGILFILQTTFSMRKRRIADLVHQRLMIKAQRFRTSFSSISFVRHSTSSAPESVSMGQDEYQYAKEIDASPLKNLSDASIPLTTGEEHEPFIKLPSHKNHVQFLLGEVEESDENDESEQPKSCVGKSSKLAHHEPYGEQSNAVLSMAHILDTDKPWSKYKRPSISAF